VVSTFASEVFTGVVTFFTAFCRGGETFVAAVWSDEQETRVLAAMARGKRKRHFMRGELLKALS